MPIDLTQQLENINRIINSIEGTVGVAAWTLNESSGKTPILIKDTQTFPTASTIKVPVLYELYRQVQEGHLNLNQRYELKPEHLVPGSGVLQDLSFGLLPTLRDLAVLMTVVSDNTATDMILELTGRGAVEKTMLELGLDKTFIAMTIREMLYSLAGLDVNDPTHTYQKAREIFDDPLHKADPSCQALGETNNDVSSPHDLATLLSLISTQKVLTQNACEDMIEILSRQKYNQILPLHLPPTTRVAHKTGSISGVRNDVGVVYAPGQPYVVAFMSKNLKNEVDAVQKLAHLSEAVYSYFVL